MTEDRNTNQGLERALVYSGVACVGFPFLYELGRYWAMAYLLAQAAGHGSNIPVDPLGDFILISGILGILMIATATFMWALPRRAAVTFGSRMLHSDE